MEYLSEAFKKLDILNEDAFSLDKDGAEELSDFLDTEADDDVVNIVDGEAEEEEDLEDSYVGKLILNCCTCHTDSFMDKEEVEVDEESELANVGQECPYCFSTNGFKVVGEVAPFEEESDEVEVEVEDEDGDGDTDKVTVEIEDKEDEKDEDTFEESVNMFRRKYFRENKLNGRKRVTHKKSVLESSRKHRRSHVNESVTYKDDIDTAYELQDKVWSGAVTTVKNCIEAGVGDEHMSHLEEVFDYGETPTMTEVNDYLWFDADEVYRALGIDPYDELGDDEDLEEGCYGKKGKKRSMKESRKDGKLKEANYRDAKGIEFISRGNYSDPLLKYKGKTFNYWDIEDALWDMFLEENTQWSDRDSDDPKCEAEFDKYVQENAASYLDDVMAFSESMHRRHSIRKNESIENIDIDTGEQVVHVSTEDKEPEMASGEEMVAPVSDRTERSIMDKESDSDREVDVDVDEFDEEEFDEIGESYLKNVYRNVKSYNTTSVSSRGNKLFVEGVIRFKSGKSKKTNFVFESHSITKNGKVKLIGENKGISRGRKPFTLTGKVRGSKLISESLRYNYTAKSPDGVTKRVYGVAHK